MDEFSNRHIIEETCRWILILSHEVGKGPFVVSDVTPTYVKHLKEGITNYNTDLQFMQLVTKVIGIIAVSTHTSEI